AKIDELYAIKESIKMSSVPKASYVTTSQYNKSQNHKYQNKPDNRAYKFNQGNNSSQPRYWKNRNPTRRYSQTTQTEEQSDDQQETVENESNKSEQKEQHFRTNTNAPRCYNCNGLYHFAKDCRKKKQRYTSCNLVNSRRIEEISLVAECHIQETIKHETE